jgi:hypothetical protein
MASGSRRGHSRRTQSAKLLAVGRSAFAEVPATLGALYSFEVLQPATASSKLDGLREHYASSVDAEGQRYFVEHAVETDEPAMLAAGIERLSDTEFARAKTACAIVSATTWAALDGVYFTDCARSAARIARLPGENQRMAPGWARSHPMAKATAVTRRPHSGRRSTAQPNCASSLMPMATFSRQPTSGAGGGGRRTRWRNRLILLAQVVLMTPTGASQAALTPDPRCDQSTNRRQRPSAANVHSAMPAPRTSLADRGRRANGAGRATRRWPSSPSLPAPRSGTPLARLAAPAAPSARRWRSAR